MTMKLFTLILLIPTVLFLFSSVLPTILGAKRVKPIIQLTLLGSVLSILLSFVGAFYIYTIGNAETSLLEFQNLGLSIRVDVLSMLFFGMIALLGFVIVKYSVNYLKGDARQHVFMGRIAATIASVQLFVLSGNLFILFLSWVTTSLFLHRLLVFYKERPRAQSAALKKFIVARFSDVFLLTSFLLIYIQVGSGSLATIFEAIQQTDLNASLNLELATVFLVLAAIFKSAQFPIHGWLVEVMETPTPVSALLHAGVLNAGPFVIMRMAFLLDASVWASNMLLIVGGTTAIIASVIFLTQSSIKTALGYSSIAHMGFSLFICGTGAYSAAVLHIVAHSFYKGHAFLSSGSSVDVIKTKRITTSERLKNPFRIALGVILAFAVYLGIAVIFEIDFNSNVALFAVGLVIVMSLTQVIVPIIDTKQHVSTVLFACLLVGLVATSFLGFEHIFHTLLDAQFPGAASMTSGRILVVAIMLLLFAIVVSLQVFSPSYFNLKNATKLSVYLRNGFYINSYFDKLIGAYDIKKTNA